MLDNIYVKIKSLFLDILYLIYPNNCIICGCSLIKGEKHICLHCLCELPKTHYSSIENNKAAKRFWGKIKIENVCSLYFFEQGNKVQTLIHDLKYNGNKNLGIYLGEKLGEELIKSPYYKDIDYIIPVPLHWRRMIKRGYNQSEMIAIGISRITNWAIIKDCIHRKKYNKTQTHKNKIERWENTKDIFTLSHSEKIKNKHILIVDDVLTTGATLEACSKTIQHSTNAKVSLATIACVW